METKLSLRKQILSIRKNMDEQEVQRLSRLICQKIISMDLFQKAQDICAYISINNEVDTDELIRYCHEHNKRLWLPKVMDEDMEFHRYNQGDLLTEGPFKIMEPTCNQVLIPDKNTLILMPGAVYSINKDRIGYGSGYYDKFLEKFPVCNTMALGYSFQLRESIPFEPHDIRPDYIVTELDII